jgi:thioredoxin reductase (NADPH)
MGYDLVIVGGGPTGINVAVEAKKAGLTYLILEKGMLVNSIFHFPANMTFFSTSKNLEIVDIPFISHTDKPTRHEALEYYRRITESHQLNIHYYEQVDRVLEVENGYEIISSKASYKTSNIVVATGFYDTPRMLDIPGEKLPKVKHFYDEAHPYVGQKVLVIGAANSACDVALETWQKGANVTMAIRSKEIYPKVKYWIKPNIENRIAEGSIKAHFETIVKEILPDRVILQNAEKEWSIENDFVLAMTGYKPNYSLLHRLLVPIDVEDHHKPIFNSDTLQTTKEGIYVAGVLNCGLRTSKLFIENTREHGQMIVKSILSKAI